MPNITLLRKTIGDYLGQVLTPDMAAAIELAAHELPDHSHDPAKFGKVVTGLLTIQAERFADIVQEAHLLHQAHWQETEGHRHGLALSPDYDALLSDEKAGRLLQFTVRGQWNELVGQCRMYVGLSRHTKTLYAHEDTLYLLPKARGGMTAVKLMRFAEQALLSIGVREIEADSKVMNNAEVLMQRLKYTHTANRYTKIFKEQDHEAV